MIKLQPRFLKRYAAIAKLLIKYGRGDMVKQSAVIYDAKDLPDQDSGKPEEFAHDLEALGPTFIKLGQLLSTRPDILPPQFLEPLQNLQDDVDPIPVEDIRETIESELGVRISNAFAEFEDNPLAAASLSQVHRAKLRSGKKVVIKVLRPSVRQQVVDDLAAIKEIALVFDRNTEFGIRYGLLGIAQSLEQTMVRELDLRVEYQSTLHIRQTLADFKRILVPEVFDDFSSASVLTMEHIAGSKITDISPTVLNELDRSGLASELFDAYLRQVLVEGHFHADPHPGNLILTHDHTIALIDCGMVVQVDPQVRGQMINLLLAVSEGRGADAAIAAERLGTKRNEFDDMTFRKEISRIVAEHQQKSVKRLSVGQILMSLQSVAGDTGLEVPHELRMLAKTLMNLDNVVETLDPEFDPAAALQEKASDVIQRHAREDISLGRLFRSALETTDLIQQLPGRINRITELICENKIEIKADAVDEEHLVSGLQNIANRVTIGVLLASMIIGAALMMRIETGWQLWGYPGIAMTFFLMSAIAGAFLIFRIVLTDHRR